MFVIIGGIIVLGGVLAGFMMAGGHIGALIHPSEFVTIGGAAFGAMLLMTPTKVMKDLVKGILACLKGSPYNKQAYNDLFKLLYDLLRTARRDGLLALDSHVSNPEESEIFNKYPKLAADHHVVEFICGALVPVLDGTAKPEQLAALLEAELRVVEEEHHAPIMALAKTADAMPGFGIVAAVLGIVVTMGAINGPAEEIGEKVGAALVGTFLGILISYGFLAPLCGRMEFLGKAELDFFKTIACIILAFFNDLPPKVAIEQGRRGVCSESRPDREELDALFKEAEAG
jgi:chemotaxis protein MotA